MDINERTRLIELTRKAILINEELLAEEKRFIDAVSSGQDASSLEIMNEKLNELCSKEYLYLSASKSVLQIVNNNWL